MDSIITFLIITSVILGWLSGAMCCYKINKQYRVNIMRILSLKYSGISLLAIVLMLILIETNIFVLGQQLIVNPWGNKYPSPMASWIVLTYGLSSSLISVLTGYIIYLFTKTIKSAYDLLLAVVIFVLWLVIILPMGYPILLF